jgi:hypothetical protein
MSIRHTETVDLDSLVARELPASIVAAVDDITVGLEAVESELYIGLRKGKLQVKAQLQFPIRKTLIIISFAVLIWFAFPSLQAYIPLILALLQKK